MENMCIYTFMEHIFKSIIYGAVYTKMSDVVMYIYFSCTSFTHTYNKKKRSFFFLCIICLYQRNKNAINN